MSNIIDLLQQDGFNPVRKASTNGGEYACPCPWCGGHYRFRIWPEENRYWCRKCNRKGDSIQYLRDYRNVSFWKACEIDYKRPEFKNGPRQVHQQKWQPKVIEPPSQIWQETMGKFVPWTANNLANSPTGKAAAFLCDDRYLQDKTTSGLLIGWNPKDMYIPKEKLGLVEYQRNHVWLPAGIVIPFADSRGLHRVRIRRWNSEPPYYFVPGGKSSPMIIDGPASVVLVVESELDACLLAQEAGDLCQVVALGNAQIRPDVPLFEALQASKIVLLALDTDEAGASSSWGWWRQQFPQVKRWPTIKGKDPTAAMQNGLNLRDWVKAGMQEVLI